MALGRDFPPQGDPGQGSEGSNPLHALTLLTLLAPALGMIRFPMRQNDKIMDAARRSMKKTTEKTSALGGGIPKAAGHPSQWIDLQGMLGKSLDANNTLDDFSRGVFPPGNVDEAVNKAIRNVMTPLDEIQLDRRLPIGSPVSSMNQRDFYPAPGIKESPLGGAMVNNALRERKPGSNKETMELGNLLRMLGSHLR